MKGSNHTLHSPLLDLLTQTFNITHSYFSSPVICSTNLHTYYSPFPKDKIFGSIGITFHYKWHGVGYAHLYNAADGLQAIHWARLAAHTNPSTVTILTIPNHIWYRNFQPLLGLFSNTHVIAHFAADTITYQGPTILPDIYKKTH